MAKRKPSGKEEGQNENEKIKSLQEMIATAERTITSAKQILTQIQRSQAGSANSAPGPLISSDGQVVLGTFDGQIMVGEDGKQYPVPANYASKSKLVEGDMLKLTITNEGNFVYKQIGPVERKFLIGIARKDDRGNFVIKTEDKKYQVLLAAATYFKIEPGDEITIVVPREENAVWAAIENVVRKASSFAEASGDKSEMDIQEDPYAADEKREPWEEEQPENEKEEVSEKLTAIERLKREIEEERKRQSDNDSIVDEWTPDIEQLKKEAGQPRRHLVRGQPAGAEKEDLN